MPYLKKNMANLSSLSLDVLLQILSFVAPRDIVLGARQVCLNLNHASMNISLWKTLLRRVCEENTLLSSSFPSEMTLKDLEHAATSPSRFISSLRSSTEHEVPLKVYSRKYIDVDYLMNNEMPNFSEIVSAVYLIPGGRYLITQHQSPWNSSTFEIHFWDLKVSGDAEPIPEDRMPMASLNDRAFLVPHPAHLMQDGEGIMIFACKDNVLEGQGKCQRDIFVYEIYPSRGAISFHQIASQSVIVEEKQEHITSCSFNCRKLVMILKNNRICVWDFIANMECTWSASGICMSDDIFLHDTFVVLCCNHSASIFKIPDLHLCGSMLASTSEDLEPCFHSKLPFVDHPLSTHFNIEAFESWYSNLNRPIYLDSATYTTWKKQNQTPEELTEDETEECEQDETEEFEQVTEDNVTQTIRYQLDVPSAISEIKASSQSFRLLNKTFDFNPSPNNYSGEEYRVCEDQIISYWSAERGLTIQSAPSDVFLAQPELEEEFLLLKAIYRSASVGRNLTSLCPASGRAVSCEADRYLIEIVDFLPHPNANSEPLAVYSDSG